MRLSNLFQKSDNPIVESILTYQKVLMDDINLSLRLTYNNHTYMTKPVEWVDQAIIFEAPMQGLDYVILPTGSTLDITLVAKVSLFHTRFRIVKNYRKEQNLYYVAELITPIIKKQQREAFRLEVILDVDYEPIPSHTEPNLSTNTGGSKGTCLNISIGGMCLSCAHQFHAKDQLHLNFSLEGQSLNLIGEVLFLGEHTDSGTYIHRIRFMGLDSVETNRLNRLIFEKQRQQLKYSK